MYSKKFDDFEWEDIKKLQEEVEKQKARVENLRQTSSTNPFHYSIKSSHSAHDLCSIQYQNNNPISISDGCGVSSRYPSTSSASGSITPGCSRLDRSDSGIDRQSLLQLIHEFNYSSTGCSGNSALASALSSNCCSRHSTNRNCGALPVHAGCMHNCNYHSLHPNHHSHAPFVQPRSRSPCGSIKTTGSSSTCSSTNNLNNNGSSNNIKKIIEITSLIRNIEQQLYSTPASTSNIVHPSISPCDESLPNFLTPNQHHKFMYFPCNISANPQHQKASTPPPVFMSTPNGNLPSSATSSGQSLLFLLLEQDKLDKQLSQIYSQLHHLENIRIPALLSGITDEKLKKQIEEYHRLKGLLAELSSCSQATSSGSSAIINVVRQLEPIASTVEEYLKLNQEIKQLQKQATTLNYRRSILETNRNLITQQQNRSNSVSHQYNCIGGPSWVTNNSNRSGATNAYAMMIGHRTEHLPQSASWDQPIGTGIDPTNGNPTGGYPPYNPRLNCARNTLNNNNNNKSYNWPDFSGESLVDVDPPSYEQYVNQQQQHRQQPQAVAPNVATHSRALCHDYVNQDMIMQLLHNPPRNTSPATPQQPPQQQQQQQHTQQNLIHLTLSVFVSESIIVVQARSLQLATALSNSRQYRARIVHVVQCTNPANNMSATSLVLPGDGSDWNNVVVSDDGSHGAITPHITLPIQFDSLPVSSSNNAKQLLVMLEIQLLDKGSPSTTISYMFHIMASTAQSSQRQLTLHMNQVHCRQQAVQHPSHQDEDFSATATSPRITSNLNLSYLHVKPGMTPYSAIYPRSLDTNHLSDYIKNHESSSLFGYNTNNNNNNIRRSHTYSHYANCSCETCCCVVDFNNLCPPTSQLLPQQPQQLQQQQRPQILLSPSQPTCIPSSKFYPNHYNNTSCGYSPSCCSPPQCVASTATGDIQAANSNLTNENPNDTSCVTPAVPSNCPSTSLSTTSSFKRQSPFRQPIKNRRPNILHSSSSEPINPEVTKNSHFEQTQDGLYDEHLIRQLWGILLDLDLALNCCRNHNDRMQEFACFRSRCPPNLLRLYEYFVDTILHSDNPTTTASSTTL